MNPKMHTAGDGILEIHCSAQLGRSIIIRTADEALTSHSRERGRLMFDIPDLPFGVSMKDAVQRLLMMGGAVQCSLEGQSTCYRNSLAKKKKK